MVLVFDLDDTLYEEITYVRSGLKAVAAYGNRELGLNASQSFDAMLDHLTAHGRGRVFDNWLQTNNAFTKKRLIKCIYVYRYHEPEIALASNVKRLLETLGRDIPLYLVTDGHKIVQQKKVKALKLEKIFKRIFLTHRFGLVNSKPSLHCFDIIRRIEKVEWSDLVHIGDNPRKDFLNLNIVGAKTVRIKTGAHANVSSSLAYDAALSLDSLSELPKALALFSPC